jgi:hypothetical protein
MFPELPDELVRRCLALLQPRSASEPSALLAIRATCHKARKHCCEATAEIDAAICSHAARIPIVLPRWSQATFGASIKACTMEEWATTYMRKLVRCMADDDDKRAGSWPSLSRLNIYVRTVEAALGCSNVWRLREETFFAEHHQRLCCNLLCSQVGPRFRLRSCTAGILHLSLDSVAAWFAAHGGWQLDECAALHFCHRCVWMLDCGSTLLAAKGGWLDELLNGLQPLEQVCGLVLGLVRAGREPELHTMMRSCFGAEWTSAQYARFYTMLSDVGKGICSDLSLQWRGRCYGWAQRELRVDYGAMRSDMLVKVKAAARIGETVAIFERKLNALLPTSILSRV